LGNGKVDHYVAHGLETRKSEQREDTAAGRMAAYIIDRIPAGFDVYKDYDSNERHIAEAIIDTCGRYIRFCPELGWLVYCAEDGCWKETLAESAVQRVIVQFGELLFEGTDETRAGETKFARHILSAKGISAVKTILKHSTRIILEEKELDADPYALNCKGELYDLRKGTHRPTEPEDLCGKTVYCRPEGKERDPKTGMPRIPGQFGDFIKKITSKDGAERPDLALFILSYFGYALSGDTGAGFFVNFHGEGQNGKSVLLKLMRLLFNDYAAPIPKDVVIENRFAGQFDLAGLPGVRLGMLEDAPDGRLNMDALKPIVTGGVIAGKRKFLKDFEFNPVCKIAVGSNPKLKLKDTGMAIRRRIRMVPFDYTVPDKEIVVNLEKKLLEEAGEILSLLIFLAKTYFETGGGPRGFPACEVVDQASREYLESEDLVGRYVKERIEAAPGNEAQVKDIYKDFSLWEDSEGITKKISLNVFGDRFTLHCRNKARKKYGVVYLDIKIKDSGGG
jgi:putative DNA primase/helicase